MTIDEIKKNITVLVDSREQKNYNIISRLQKNGINWKPVKLDFGDYSFECNGISFRNICVIESKANLDELAGNLTVGRDRFAREFARAVDAGCKITLLIQDEKGREKLISRRYEDGCELLNLKYDKAKTYRSKFKAKSFINSLSSWKERYGLTIAFVSKVKAQEYIMGVFYEAIDNYFQKQNGR